MWVWKNMRNICILLYILHNQFKKVSFKWFLMVLNVCVYVSYGRWISNHVLILVSIFWVLCLDELLSPMKMSKTPTMIWRMREMLMRLMRGV